MTIPKFLIKIISNCNEDLIVLNAFTNIANNGEILSHITSYWKVATQSRDENLFN